MDAWVPRVSGSSEELVALPDLLEEAKASVAWRLEGTLGSSSLTSGSADGGILQCREPGMSGNATYPH